MDTIGGLNVVYFSGIDVINLLKSDLNLLKDKKFMEAFVGYIVSSMLEREYSKKFIIGFPLKQSIKHYRPVAGPSLLKLIHNPLQLDDSDVDIYISEGGVKATNYPFPCQITRLPYLKGIKRSSGDILSLLQKKFNVQSDKRKILIINIEDEVTINIDDLKSILENQSVPYGTIYIVGKCSEKPHKFRGYQLYPDFRVSEEFDIGVPL